MSTIVIIDGWDFSPEQLMSPAEVARAFRVDPKTVTRWGKAGTLTSLSLPSGHRRYSRQQVEAVMRGETTPPAPAVAEQNGADQ